MSHRHNARHVEMKTLADLLQILEAMRDVFKRARPSSTGIAHTPILHVPRRVTGLGQRGTQMSSMSQVVTRPPESAMDVDHHGMRSWPTRDAQIGKVIWI